jgi:hypothetical protein
MGFDFANRGPDTHADYLAEILNSESLCLRETADIFRRIDGPLPTFRHQVAVSMYLTRAHCSLTQVSRSVYQTRVDFPTEFRAQKIVPAVAESCAKIKDTIAELEAATQPAWQSAVAEWQPERPYTGTIASRLRSSALEVGLLDDFVGTFSIWIKTPNRAKCASLNRAWKKSEPDYEDFLTAVRRNSLGLAEPQLDPYIAQVLLGMRIRAGEIRLPADLRNLPECADDEIWPTILRLARSRWLKDKYGSEDHLRVNAPGEEEAARRYDALSTATFLDQN